MSQITLLVKVKAKAGYEDALLQALTAMISPSRAEAGCIQYDLNGTPDNRSIFWFVERWASQNALDAHNQTPHFLTLQNKIADLTESVEAVKLQPLEIGASNTHCCTH